MNSVRKIGLALTATLLGATSLVAVPSAAPAAVAGDQAACQRQTLFAVHTDNQGVGHISRYDNANPWNNEAWMRSAVLSRSTLFANAKNFIVDGNGRGKVSRLLVTPATGPDAGRLFSYAFSDDPNYIANPRPVDQHGEFSNYKSLTSPGHGVLLGLHNNGELHVFNWNEGAQVYVKRSEGLASNWGAYTKIIAGADGVLYAQTLRGDGSATLRRYQFNRADFSLGGDWIPQEGNSPSTQVSGSWGSMTSTTASGQDNVYALEGHANVYRYDMRVGAPTFIAMRPQVDGTVNGTAVIAADPAACANGSGTPTTAGLRQRIVNNALSIPAGTRRAQFCSQGRCWSSAGAWCQDYAWWAWAAAGVPGPTSGIYWTGSFGEVPGATRKALSQAQPGDIVHYTFSGGGRHVAVVTRVENGHVYVSDGNWGDPYVQGVGWVRHDREATQFTGAPDYIVSPPGV